MIEHSPAVHARRRRLDYESHAVGLDRNETRRLPSCRRALVASRPLLVRGLRISEALGADIDQLGLERGNRTLVVHRKGGKTVTIPLAPRAVFFGFWISHVPEDKFTSFWSMVAKALKPGGRVFFFDDNYRPEAELVEGVRSRIVQRKLNDGTPFRVVKIPYEPADLEQRMRDLQWNVKVTGTSGPFYWGTGVR